VPALAVESCELNGQHVNPNNGNTTAGKTGLMRCRDGEGGAVVREQELQGGAFRGAVRYYKDGQLEKEYRVNERGNRDGVAREYARGEAGAKPVLVREETYRDGRTVGLARSWYPNGQLRRVSFHGDDDREQASAEFTPTASSPSCAARRARSSAATPTTRAGAAMPAAVERRPLQRQGRRQGARLVRARRAAQERAARRRRRGARSAGGERRAAASSDRSTADGVKRREVQWVVAAASAPAASSRSTRSSTRAASSCASGAGASSSAAASSPPSSTGT
jgi:hypothetical protein